MGILRNRLRPHLDWHETGTKMTQTATELDSSPLEDFAPACDARIHTIVIFGGHLTNPHYDEPPCENPATYIVTEHNCETCPRSHQEATRTRLWCAKHLAWTLERNRCPFCGTIRIKDVQAL